MLLTIKMILEQKLLDEYMPDRGSKKTRQSKILDWIKEGKLKAQGNFKKKKMISSEAITKFKEEFYGNL